MKPQSCASGYSAVRYRTDIAFPQEETGRKNAVISPKQAQKLPRVILLILKVKENPLWFSVLPSRPPGGRCHPTALLDLSPRALYRDTTSGTEEGTFSLQTQDAAPPLEAQKGVSALPRPVLRVAALRISGWPLGSSFPVLKVTHVCRLAFLPYEEGSQPSFISCGLCLL